MEYFITFECECGETIKEKGLDVSGNEIPEIPWNIASTTTFECKECGKKYYTGDFDYMNEDEI